jgi:hypothetical protein
MPRRLDNRGGGCYNIDNRKDFLVVSRMKAYRHDGKCAFLGRNMALGFARKR